MSTLKYNTEELNRLLKNFHILTGMLFSLYDNEGNPVTYYPLEDNRFCQIINSSAEGSAKCRCSDLTSFEASGKSGECVIYTCHAGLLEATAPIITDGTVMGYLMLGQISNAPSYEELKKRIHCALLHTGISDSEWEDTVSGIPLHSDIQIQAAAEIMESCISYILCKNLISVQRQNFELTLNDYILTHLGGDLSIESICNHLHISRRKLYDYSRQFLHRSVAKHIKCLRLSHARELLKNTALPVSSISEQCGFADYNYFCRVFKKENGMPAGVYRKQHQQN